MGEFEKYLTLSKRRDKAMIAYKVVRSRAPAGSTEVYVYYLVVLYIAARTHTVFSKFKDGKCRTARAKVLAMYPLSRVGKMDYEGFKAKTKEPVAQVVHRPFGGHADSGTDFIYEVGKYVQPRLGFDASTSDSCRSGIHFFRSALDAVSIMRGGGLNKGFRYRGPRK